MMTAPSGSDPPTLKIYRPVMQQKSRTRLLADHHFLFLKALAKAKSHGMTDDELAGAVRKGKEDARSRRNELVFFGYVKHSGKFRPTSRGRKAKVWTLTTAGKEKASQLKKGNK